MMKLALCALALLLLNRAAAQDDCCFSINKTSRQFMDTYGRARIFHGVNIVYKRFPYHPINATFDPQLSLSSEDVTFLKENGFSVVRLYVAWPGLEPSKGSYNSTYLDVLADFVDVLGKAGIYTILDCHQDVWSPKFCGEGAPDYAALYENRTIKPLQFPTPIPTLSPFKVDPKTGYPDAEECSKHNFFTYYFTDAVGKTMQSLYDNEQQIQDHFGMFWERVAERFEGNEYVLAYELLNEPWAGDVYRHPDQLEPHVADAKNLQPMYKKLHESIRKYDQKHIIMFEPTIIITSVPVGGFANTGLSEGPGGPAFNDRQALSYHLYCVFLDSHGQPSNTRFCDASNKEVVGIRMDDAKKLGVAGFLTEWGAYDDATYPGSKPYEDALDILRLADQHLQSWTYWQYKGYGDFTTQSSSASEGLWFMNGSLQTHKLELLTRTYAKAVSGDFVSQTFSPETGNFLLSFIARTKLAHAPSLIYLNEDIHYPNGFTVSVSPSGAAVYSTSHNTIELSLSETVMDGQVLTVEIVQKT
ncbi:endoglycoceramidase-like [Halichondria panicea]|uniref:endoglycoceramidase-like n=1 Tax=Halichondria panicea TaxID=6063 RepID=UPI00312B9CB3